jgi:hypothetical protein
VVQQKQAVLEVVEEHSCAKSAVGETKVEAFLDLQVFHNQWKRRFDALSELIQTSQARLVHNSVVDCRREDLKVFVDALHKKG